MITVGIPTLNGPELLDRCLTSIEECTNSFDHVKVLVCDDGSTPENLKLTKDAVHRRERLRAEAGLEMLVSEKRSGIACSWNKLTRHHSSEVIILLNNDIEVVEHWLDVLVYSVRANECAGMVGLNSYVGLTKSQHASLHPDSLPHERDPRVDYYESSLLDGGGSLMWAPGYAFAFRRSAFDMVGGFDERYFCFYEEVDFGISLRTKGLYSFVASYPVVYHMGGATTSNSENMNANEHLFRSRLAFKEKWGRTSAEMRDALQPGYVRPKLREWNTQVHHHKD